MGGQGQKDAEAGGEKGLRRSALGFHLGREGGEPWRTEPGASAAPAAMSKWGITEAGRSGMGAEQAGV